MKRTTIMLSAVAVLAAVLLGRPAVADEHGDGSARLQLVEATIPELQKAMRPS